VEPVPKALEITEIQSLMILTKPYPVQTRQLLRKLLPRRIRVRREVCGDDKRYCFEGEAADGRF